MTDTTSDVQTVTLYNKYRPQRFDQIVGQKPVVHAFSNILKKGSVSHAYLFAGPRGTGKTSTARLFAKSLNCLNPDGVEPCNVCDSCIAITNGTSLDVVEYDAASKGGVDSVRDILSEVSFSSPGKKKVYIFDEAHMFSNPATTALLKTLEEPPPHVVFILATTDPKKLIPTVVSRCQTYEFKLVSPPELGQHFRRVAELEGLSISDAQLQHVVYAAQGSVRDGMSILETVGIGEITPEIPRAWDVVRGIAKSDLKDMLSSVAKATQDGMSPRVLAEEIVATLREFFLIQMGCADLVSTPEWENRTQLAQEIGAKKTVLAMELVADAIATMQSNYDQRINLEVALARYAKMS